ncbi:MAG TPA: hypothetical protein PLQ76_09270, partial [bacterium]|nr:hypothetical protein [bacterium]
LSDVFDTLNLHSSREAVSSLHRGEAIGMISGMQQKTRNLLHNLPKEGFEAEAAEARETEALLDAARRCSTESENYSHFVETLLPLLRRLSEWGDRGAVSRDKIEELACTEAVSENAAPER